MRIIVIMIFIGVLNFSLYGQQKNWKESVVDSTTYQLYVKSAFKSLIQEGKEAIRNNVDFYYMRLRLGEAYYYEQQPLVALQHFKKALEFQPSDAYAKKWLVEVYALLGWAEEAKTLLATLDLTTQQLNAYKIGKERLINVEAGVQIPTFTALNESNQEYVEYNRMNSIFYQQIGYKFPLSNRVNLYTGFLAIQNQRTQSIDYTEHMITNTYSKSANLLENPTLDLNSGYYMISNQQSNNKKKSFGANLQQYHAYIGATVLLPKDLKMQIGLNYFNIQQILTTASYHGIVFLDSTITDPYLYRFQSKYSLNTSNSSSSNRITNFSFSKAIGKWNPKVNFTLGSFDSLAITQIGGSISYAPFGNLSLCYELGFSQLHDTKTRNVFLGKVTGKITDNWWFEATLHLGDLTNYTEGNGYVVYNVSDKITAKVGTNLTYYFSSSLACSFRYDWMQRQYPIVIVNNGATTLNHEKYINRSFLTSLIWKF